jgi:hypothetical protein
MNIRNLVAATAFPLATMLTLVAATSTADAAVIKAVYVENFQGTSPLDSDSSNCLGYPGQIYEDRHGQYQITYHTDGANSDAANVEGTVYATFRISPLNGNGVVYSGSYREHSAGTFKTIDGQDVPYPSATYLIHGDGTGTDGSTLRFTAGGHFVLDRKTGAQRLAITMGECHVQ